MKTLTNFKQRKNRVRAKVIGSAERPRLSIYISNQHLTAQVIDDTSSQTLAQVTTVGQSAGKTLTEKAAWIGDRIAKAAKAKNVRQVVFDRGGRQYRGRLHALAEAARKEGLEF